LDEIDSVLVGMFHTSDKSFPVCSRMLMRCLVALFNIISSCLWRSRLICMKALWKP